MFECRPLFLSKLLKKSSKNTIRVSNSLDPDWARRFVGPDLDSNCLQIIRWGILAGKEFDI